MAENFDVHSGAFPLNITSSGAGSVPLMYVPAAGGGITLLRSDLTWGGNASGTLSGVQLITFTHGSGALTIAGTLGTIAAAAGTATSSTSTNIPLTSAQVSPGTAGIWVGIKYTLGTTVNQGSYLNLTWVQGIG